MLLLFCGESEGAAGLLRRHLPAELLSQADLRCVTSTECWGPPAQLMRKVTEHYSGPYILEISVFDVFCLFRHIEHGRRGNVKALCFVKNGWGRIREADIPPEAKLAHAFPNMFSFVEAHQTDQHVLRDILRLVPEPTRSAY